MRHAGTDEQWRKLFKVLGESNVDLPHALEVVSRLVLLEREEYLARQSLSKPAQEKPVEHPSAY